MSQAAPFPSYDELAALAVELRGELAQARARIADLEAQLVQNSTNSSKPPSSDGLAKPALKSLRGKSGRGPGRPKGQPGATLRQVETPEETFTHRPGPCTGCGADLLDAPVVGVERRQVFDLPEEIRLQVTEHQLLSIRCACGKKARAAAPAQVAAPVQYGPRLATVGGYLMHGQFLSKDRTARALADLFGASVAVATVAGWVRRCARTLDTFGRVVAEQVARAPLAFFDETGFRTCAVRKLIAAAWSGLACRGNLLEYCPRSHGSDCVPRAVLPILTMLSALARVGPFPTWLLLGHARTVLAGAESPALIIFARPRGSRCGRLQSDRERVRTAGLCGEKGLRGIEAGPARGPASSHRAAGMMTLPTVAAGNDNDASVAVQVGKVRLVSARASVL